MNILVACEESQAVCKEFRRIGHNAYSCDLEECSGGHPEWHIKGDCLKVINGNCEFTTQDGKRHRINQKWDLLIAHPPCTYLTLTGNRWFNKHDSHSRSRCKKEERSKHRSRTFTGVAKAMAEQWSDYLVGEKNDEHKVQS